MATDGSSQYKNRGTAVGKKPPLTRDEISLMRLLLRQDSRTQPAGVREIIEIRQKKTEARNARPVQARLSAVTNGSLRIYLAASERPLRGWLFTR